VWLLLTGVRYPTLTLVFFLITIAYFRITDSIVALAWFDLLGKALSPFMRARLLGLGQVTTGLAALGAGVVIRYVFSAQGPAFPYNYAVVIGLAGLCYTLSEVSCTFIVEVPEAVSERRPSLREYLPQLASLLRQQAAFRRVTLVRLLAGLGALASTFYVLYATQVLALPPVTIGLFAGAATAGAALAGVLLGAVADRWGPQRVIQVITWCQFAVPLLALLIHLGVFGAAAGAVFPLLYVLMGVFDGSVMLGFLTYLLEIAPPGERPTYIGLTNTLSGLLVVVPLAGGWILEHSSYPLLFGLAAVGILPAAVLALGLPNPRRSPVAANALAPAADGERQAQAAR
jgi:MFS-type transporter involved in bile tolerance (Atg22 family)